MKSTRILYRKTFGLDNSIWRVMLVLIILSAALLSYRLLDKKECVEFSFNINHLSDDSVYQINETMIFTASVKSADISWDFGDGTPVKEGQIATHQFVKEGKYRVVAKVGSECETVRVLNVSNPLNQLEVDNISTENKIEGRSIMYAGTVQTFTCLAEADHYGWTILNHPEIRDRVREGKTATYTFVRPGSYTIQVELNHDQKKQYTKNIQVNLEPVTKEPEIKELIPASMREKPKEEKPAEGKPSDKFKDLPPRSAEERRNQIQPEKQPEKQVEKKEPEKPEVIENTTPVPEKSGAKTLGIRDEIFLDLLKRVQNEGMDISGFNRYLSMGGNTRVLYNGKAKNFSWLWNELNGNNKITLQSVQLNRDEEKNVILINVSYKKKNIIQRTF